MARAGFRKRLTNRLVSFLEENGGLPFQSGPEGLSCRPFNPVSGTKPRGGNVLNLIHGALERGSNDPRWMTLKQANSMGYRVRRHAKGELLEYWDWGQVNREPQLAVEQPAANATERAESPAAASEPRTSSPAMDDSAAASGTSPDLHLPADTMRKGAGARLPTPDINDEEAQPPAARKPTPFYAVVFNGSDIVGLPEMSPDLPWRPHELAKQLLVATGVSIEHRPSSRAARRRSPANDSSYDASTGRIIMPPRESFKTDTEYYASALRQLAHWASHALSTNGSIEPGTPESAKREFRAELAANLLTSMVGLAGPRGPLAHSENWPATLKRDPHEVFRAARDAEQFIEYIFDSAPELKALVDSRVQDNLLSERPKRKLDSGIDALPNFVPPQAVDAPVRTGRADPRWHTFETSVKDESKKYGISQEMITETLRLLETQFSDVMNAAERNGYTVGDMNAMLVTQLVEEMRANNHREQTWTKYRQQVHEAASDLMPAERIEAELQHIGHRYRELVQEGSSQNWDSDRAEAVLNELLFGQSERCPITPEYIRRRFLPSADPTAATHQDDDAFLTPIEASISVDDSFPADAAALPDEPVATTATRPVRQRVSAAPAPGPHRERRDEASTPSP